MCMLGTFSWLGEFHYGMVSKELSLNMSRAAVIVAHLTIISLGVFLTLIGVLIIRETRKTNDS